MGYFYLFFGMVVAACPIGMSIVSEPQQFLRLLDPVSYWGYEKEIIYWGVAISALAAVDLMEALPGIRVQPAVSIFISILIPVIIVEIIWLVSFYKSARPVTVDPLVSAYYRAEHIDKLTAIAFVVAAALFIALACRRARILGNPVT
jgi:hypothetical protein